MRIRLQIDLQDVCRGEHRRHGDKGPGAACSGGKLSKVAGQADAALHNVTDSKTREKAFTAAVDEVQPRFHRCNICRAWVCEEQCWDDEYNLCTTSATEQRQQEAAPQVAAPVPQVSEARHKRWLRPLPG